jgi:hypothetical protein
VSEDRIEDAIEMSTDDPEQLKAIQTVVRAAWLASADLDSLGLWISPTVGEDERKALTSMTTQETLLNELNAKIQLDPHPERCDGVNFCRFLPRGLCCVH